MHCYNLSIIHMHTLALACVQSMYVCGTLIMGNLTNYVHINTYYKETDTCINAIFTYTVGKFPLRFVSNYA